MRIAVVASLVTPLLPVQAGGAQAFLVDLARGLAGRGHSVQLYCAEGSEVAGVELVEIPVEAGVGRALVMPGGAPAGEVPELRRGFESLFTELRRRGADVVSQHAFDAEALELAAGLPVLHTLHLPPIVPAVVAAARACREPLATVSAAMRRAWSAAGVETRVLPDGVPDWEPEPGPVARVALLAGRISPEKGIEDGVAAARLAGLRPLVVGGDYDRAYRESLEDIEVRPPLPRAELWRLMAASAVTVLPARWEEPFGLVAAEAQVAGCPVAAYARGALAEVVRDGEGGFLARANDVADLARAIGDCLCLDRAGVRAQARPRLLLEGSLDAYEEALR
ncbi:MAG TPA: glycosyltransferase [Candidatus Dormibacteraeota bacterium]|nr:glycosyltransferase [Candidatus Dormibacteraeota bacterium]